MRRPTRGTQWVALLMVLTQTLALSLSGVFQLWPRRLTTQLPASTTKDSHLLNHRQSQAPKTSTTTTSTSTTTPSPHTELVFLIDARDLNQQEHGGDQQDAQTLNDTILEEVVNQINRNIKLNWSENCTNCGGQNSHKLQTISEFEEASNQLPDGRANKSAQYKMADEQAEPTTTTTTTTTTSASVADVVRGSQAEVDDELNDENNSSSSSGAFKMNEIANETSSELDDDRHIQYDAINTSSLISYEQLRRQQLNESDSNQMTTTNFTLAHSSPMKAPIDGELKLDANSRQVSSAPLIIVSAVRNVSVDTPTTSADRPPTAWNITKTSSQSQRAATNTSQAQARSMSGISSRLPQHSKAPYASYNMFNQPRQDQSNPHYATETTPSPSGGLVGKVAPAQSISQMAPINHNNNNNNNNSNQSNHQPVQQVTNSTGSLQEGAELANSIGKISSHLISESSRNQAAQTSAGDNSQNQTSSSVASSQTSAHSMKPMSLTDKLQAYLSGNQNSNASRQEPSSELERVVSKLALTNELVELDPLPSSEQSRVEAQTLMSERHFSASSGQNQHRDQIDLRQGDRYPAEFFTDDGSLQYYHQMAHGEQSTGTQLAQRGASEQIDFDRDNLKNVVGELLSDGAQLDEQPATPAPILHRKTLEILSNQIKNSDSSLLAGQSSNTMAVHQHRERSPPAQQAQQQQHNTLTAPVNNRDLSGGSRHYQPTGGTFAASLINVTAPMVLPLSASEAMENSVAAQFQQQQQQQHQPDRQPAAPHRSNYYVAPPQSSNAAHESIYMRPLNQFRPTTTTTTTSSTPSGHELGASERDRSRFDQRLTASQFASGFRSPQSQFNPSASSQSNLIASWLHGGTNIPTPASYLNALEATSASSSLTPLASPSSASMATTLPSISSSSTNQGSKYTGSTPAAPPGGAPSNKDNMHLDGSLRPQPMRQQQQQNSTANLATNVQKPQHLPATTNGFITGTVANATNQHNQTDLIGTITGGSVLPSSVSTQVVANGDKQQSGVGKRVFNLTRVEHISAECSNDLIRTIIIFNGTFKGIIYSSGYVRDQNCLYINGTGKTRYDFSIKLNQCGTLGRQELHSPVGPDEVRRRDQVMWNSLSIQYNPIIEQEWDEHFRVSCEYGSDFWKTISFNPFKVETNTGSPVVFTVDPPQCQMEILKGHGMVGPRQEATSGPVTVGDPLTLLIHMKSEKAGYDILVKNCIAHDGSQQKMQLIDSNGCVVNERFISPFRGTYNDQDLKHVTLYSYLKAFRFTGSPVLYLECEVHMCQSACPPQMCYWRSISKRSIGGNTTSEMFGNFNSSLGPTESYEEFDEFGRDLPTSTTTEASTTTRSAKRRSNQQRRTGKSMGSNDGDAAKRTADRLAQHQKNLSDKISLTRALEVRQERFNPDPMQAATGLSPSGVYDESLGRSDVFDMSSPGNNNQLMCYQRVEIFAFLFTVASILLAAVSVTIGCYCRASSLKRQSMTSTGSGPQRRPTHRAEEAKLRHAFEWLPRVHPLSSLNDSANLCYSPMSSSSASSPLSSPIAFVGGCNNDNNNNNNTKRSTCSPYLSSNDSTRPQFYSRAPSSFNILLGAGVKGDNLIQKNQGHSKRPLPANYNQRPQLARPVEINDERLFAAKLARRN